MEPFSNFPNNSKVADWDSGNTHKTNVIINDYQRYIITLINNVLLCQIISLFGCVTNVINLVVFYRQGLNTTINISFFSLAISDLCSLVMQQVSNIFVNPSFVALNLPMVYAEVQFASARIGRGLFAKITLFITVYITFERCMCIAFPLHIKQMITPKKTVVVLFCIYILTLATFLPLMGSLYIDWKFHPGKNMTVLGVVYRKYKRFGIATSYFVNAILGAIAFLSVVILTLILTIKLRQKSKWRTTANVQDRKSQSISQRDVATVKMVVAITGILIVCYIPSTFLCLATFIEPEFRDDGMYQNLYSSLWSVVMVTENINASVNIFFYCKMSSKYRQAFQELISTCLCEKKDNRTTSASKDNILCKGNNT